MGNSGVCSHFRYRQTKKDNEGRTTLWFAAANGRTDTVRALVSAGADVNTQRHDGWSALSVASQEGHSDIANMLLEKGAKVETRDKEGCTALWRAAKGGHVKVIDLLIDRGADVDLIAYDGYSPICIAAKKGHKNAVIALMKHATNLTHLKDEYHYPLGVTAIWDTDNVEDITKILIDNGACINPAINRQDESPLMLAVHRGRFDVVNILVEYGADIYVRNYDNMQPIDVASYCGHTDIVQLLSSCKSTVLCGSNFTSLVDFRVDCHCNTAMHLTTNLQSMTSLIENGADVDAENVDGLRPIHCAVRTKVVELVKLLIQHGANVDATDVFGNTPLHDAVCRGLNVVQVLVQHGKAKLNVQNTDGKTPLHIAVERQQSDVIVFLLSQDVDVALTDVWRNTALHYITSELFTDSVVIAKNILTWESNHSVIRNAVNVSALMTIAAQNNQFLETVHSFCNNVAKIPTLSNNGTRQVHDINFFGREKLDADCYGNTPLHYAVGVYGQLKMYRVSTNVTKTVTFLVECGADINTQNKEGRTPLHVARGKEAINVCLQHADDQSFTITDESLTNGVVISGICFFSQKNKTTLN